MSYKYRIQNTVYKRKWMERRRAAFMAGKKCAECGTKKKLVIVWGMGRNRTLNFSAAPARFAKAVKDKKILCRTCWLASVGKGRRAPLVHGTRKGYQTHGCRCKLCKASEAKRRRLSRHKRLLKHPGKRELERRKLEQARKKLIGLGITPKNIWRKLKK